MPWPESTEDRRRILGFAGAIGVLTLVFVQPLARLFVYTIQDQLHSHVPLIPLVSAYLFYLQPTPRLPVYRRSVGGTVLFAAIGIAGLAARLQLRQNLSVNDDLALLAFAYVSFVVACGFLCLGTKWMTAAAFPFAFLIFMVPLPDAAVTWLETQLVLASAEAAALLFYVTGTPLLRAGTIFALPGIVLKVAQECSGIHSSWVLFITSLLASRMFLQSPWRRFALVAFVIPLGILRNGFRILVIGLLCVHIGPHMIDSVIHHQGGPLFFALSLVPLVLFLAWLRRQEHRVKLPQPVAVSAQSES